jgi:prepilin-type N-terminal cleavage/methylation domain-containing protein
MVKKRGFTLIELLVVIVIIATLLAFLYPTLSSAFEKGKIAQDASNLRQIGLATQTYLNDNEAFFLPSSIWMNSLHPTYLSSWKIFQSPFDKRAASESNTNAPVSYGFNLNAHGTSATIPLLAQQVTNPTLFILFAPSQDTSNAVNFAGTASASVTVNQANGAQGGTHNKRQRINVCMADLHMENMLWSTYISNTATSSDPCAPQRWNPTITCP